MAKIMRLWNDAMPRTKSFSAMGSSGTPVYGGTIISPERSSKLLGQEKYRTFSDILANTSIVAAGMRYFLNIVARPEWSCEPADQSDEAKKLAEFVEETLFENLRTPWSRIVRRTGTYRFYGFAIQEWIAQRNEDGTIGFKDIESRPQWTIWRWGVDDKGKITGAWQHDPLTGQELGLPRNKILYLVDDTLTDSPEGMGLLRHVVEPVNRLTEYLKQEGYGFTRDLRGIPIGRAPIEELQNAVKAGKMTQVQMDQAIDTLMEFVMLERKSNKTGIMLNSQPYVNQSDSGMAMAGQYKWGVELASGQAPGLPDVHNAINRINTEIARVLGIEHLMIGGPDSAGAYSMAKDKSANLYLLCDSVLRDITLQAQYDLLTPLWSLNGWDEKLMPKLRTEGVAPKDVEQISRTLLQMAQAGAPIPPGDEETINFVRDILGIPHVDMSDVESMFPPDIVDAQAGYPSIQQQQDLEYQMQMSEQERAAAAEDEKKKPSKTAKKRLGGNGFDHDWQPEYSKRERVVISLD